MPRSKKVSRLPGRVPARRFRIQRREAVNQTTTYTYDANGNRTGVTDPLGRRTTQAYDALNRLIVLTDPANGQTRIGYDSQDRATQVTDPRNLVTRYDIDGLGNLLQQTSPDTGSTQSRYDEAGNLVGRTDAKGQGIVLQYDVLNRPTQVGYPDGREERYTWDQGTNGIGRLTRIDERQDGQLTVSTGYGYDPHGRLTRETRTDGTLTLTTAYAYQNGVLTGITYPSGKQVSYARDAQGRISRIDLTDDGQTQTVVSQVAYHPFGGLKSYVDGAGHVMTRNQDTDGRTSAYRLGSGLWQLGYDSAGRIVSQGDGSTTASYGYDSLDRLTSAVTPTATWSYGYDANGNRTSQTTGNTTATYQIDPTSNRLLSIAGPTPRSYVYDANGSVIDDGQAQYRYDARGRMTQATTADGSTEYRIDAEGRRIAKANATGDTRYVYDRAGHLLAEMDANGKAAREYLWLGDVPVGVMQSPTGAGFELPLGFAGQVRDRETGLSQNGFRDYSPLEGRYRQFDLIGLRGGINGYGYVGGNPVSRIDPLGLEWSFSVGLGATVAAGWGIGTGIDVNVSATFSGSGIALGAQGTLINKNVYGAYAGWGGQFGAGVGDAMCSGPSSLQKSDYIGGAAGWGPGVGVSGNFGDDGGIAFSKGTFGQGFGAFYGEGRSVGGSWGIIKW